MPTVRPLLPLLAALLCLPAAAQSGEDEARVLPRSVLRAEPSARAAVVQRLGAAQRAQVLGCAQDAPWCEVVLAGGMRGWVAEGRLQDLPESRTAQAGEEEDLDHRTDTPLPWRGMPQPGTGVVGYEHYGYGYSGGTVIYVAPRGGPGEPLFPMRPGWARGQPMPR